MRKIKKLYCKVLSLIYGYILCTCVALSDLIIFTENIPQKSYVFNQQLGREKKLIKYWIGVNHVKVEKGRNLLRIVLIPGVNNQKNLKMDIAFTPLWLSDIKKASI